MFRTRIEYNRITDAPPHGTSDSGLTQDQREAIFLALEMGYFEDPREATLSDVAAELGISQPAAGGRLRRGTPATRRHYGRG